MAQTRKPELIYVVEDEAAIARLIADTLEKFSYRTELFRTAEAFFHGLRHQVPDLVVLDLGLPDMDGQQVLRVHTHLQRRLALVADHEPVRVRAAAHEEEVRVAEAVDAQRRYGHHFLVGSREHRVGNAVVARGKNDNAAFHGTCLIAVLIAPGILDKIVNCRFIRRINIRNTGSGRIITPAVLTDNRSIIGTILNSRSCII